MSNNIIQLSGFRAKQKQQWLKQNSSRIESFFTSFITTHIPVDFTDVSSAFLANQASSYESSWNYIDLREQILEAFEASLGDILFDELKEQKWYETRFMSRDYALERCLSTFILGTDRAIVAGE